MNDDLENLLWENRRLFRAMAAAADAALEPLGIQTADRALLEFLARESEPISLSDLARKRSVSRQHIQQSLNRLPNSEWVEKLADPADARSVLLRLSREGQAFWKRVRTVDAAMLRRLGRHVGSREVRQAARTLRKLRDFLEGGER